MQIMYVATTGEAHRKPMRTLVRELPTSRAQTKQVMKRRARSDTGNSFSKKGRTHSISELGSHTRHSPAKFCNTSKVNDIYNTHARIETNARKLNPLVGTVSVEKSGDNSRDTGQIYCIIASISWHFSVQKSGDNTMKNKKHQNVSCSTHRYDRCLENNLCFVQC